MAGWVNCDMHATDGADVRFDCTCAWPFPDNSASIVYASHTLEHLVDFRGFFREAHRVLHDGAVLQLRVPYGGHGAAWWDVSHVRPWFAESFCFLQPGYAATVNNAQHQEWTSYFGVEDVVLRIDKRMLPILRWRLGRMLLIPWLDKLQNVIEELWVFLVVLKDQERIEHFKRMRNASGVPGRYAVYRHQWERRPMNGSKPLEFVTLAKGENIGVGGA